MSWAPDQNRRGNIQIVDCNGNILNSGWTTSGYTTITLPANGSHHYLFQEERWFYHNFYGWGWWGDLHPGRLLEVYIDNVNQNHPQNVIGSYNGLPTDFDLRFNGSICPNNYAALSLGDENWNNCNVPGYYAGDAAEVNIIQGSEYVEFIDISTETILGNAVQLNDYVGINNIGLKRKDNAPSVQTTQIVSVEANINGVKDTSEIDYYPDGFTATVEVYPETLTTGESTYIDISYYSECGPLPPETKINLEIIDGTVYGNLVDPYTNDRVKTITNLDHWWGYAWVEYIADGNSTQELDTIKVRISTTDTEITPKEISVYIKPPPIYVYTIPEVLGADDTANVIIKHRLEDGTLEDFPPEQTFELGVLDGCVNGNFMVDDSINVYFADALQPIKFVTADIIDTTFDKILIRVGTDLGGGGVAGRPVVVRNGEEEKIITEKRSRVDSLRTGFEKMIAEKEAEAKKKEYNEPPIEAPIVTACYPYGPNKEFNWQGFASVGNGCSPLCSGEPPFTNILTTRLYNIYFDPCEDRDKDPTTLELGGFTPVKRKENWRNPSYFHPCFDGVEQVWRFSVNDIQLYVSVDFCQNYLSRYQVISNISGVDSSEVCDAVKDFKNHEFYPLRVRNGGYMIMALLEKHEEIHERVYLEYMTENKEAFDRIFSEFKPPCEEYPNQMLANAGALEKLDPLINSYFSKNYEKWQDDMGWTEPIDKLKRKQDEDKTQNHPEVQAIWNNYIKSLEVLFPSKYKKCK
ncbi:MAG: hypothetical protein M5U17_06145 [Ignavibacterium sp.]|nr:hypothetical protein [Ignavibacterium sp.]